MTAINVRTAQVIPTLPILTVIFSNFCYNNVGSYSNWVFSVITPAIEFFPTAITIPFPFPCDTND
jgi:hypothetical protein